MRRFHAKGQLWPLVGLLLVSSACQPTRNTFDPAGIERWRTMHEEDYRREWVTVAGLHFLEPGRNTAGSASSSDIVLPRSVPPTLGDFVLTGEQVGFEPAADTDVQLRGERVTSPTMLKDDGDPMPDELMVGDVRLVIHLSGKRKSVRVRDPQGEVARGFRGFAWFPIDSRYHVAGRFIKDDKPKRVQVVNTIGDLDTYRTEGVVEFTLNGTTLRLRPFTTRPGRLYFVFRDASAGQETYETARFLYSDLDGDGTTMLDFNEAYNPPCSFNPYTTCPIPLPENRVGVKILAGERAYAGAATH